MPVLEVKMRVWMTLHLLILAAHNIRKVTITAENLQLLADLQNVLRVAYALKTVTRYCVLCSIATALCLLTFSLFNVVRLPYSGIRKGSHYKACKLLVSLPRFLWITAAREPVVLSLFCRWSLQRRSC